MLTCIHTYIHIHTYITYMYISVLLLNNWLQKYPYMHTYIHTICQSAYFHPRTRAFAARPGRRERSRCLPPSVVGISWYPYIHSTEWDFSLQNIFIVSIAYLHRPVFIGREEVATIRCPCSPTATHRECCCVPFWSSFHIPFLGSLSVLMLKLHFS